MTTYTIDLRRSPKEIHPIALASNGLHPSGDQISFTNYYLELNQRPFFGVCGEFHFSRYPAQDWEAELIKMRVGGVNIVSTYVFWIHHEEEEEHFRWDGDRNLRYFVELCAKHGLYVIVRIGPFAHGECRNGGFPDWLYGRSFELRSNDPGYLEHVRRLYGEIGRQVRGQFYQDGGAIIAIQLENEFMHAAAPWEVAPRQAREWLPGGVGGVEHMRILKQLAQEAGLEAPFYTSTGWGGAPVLEGEILPLYGGYAFCPWNITEQRREHAPTQEYLFRNYHENGSSWDGAEPPYQPEAYPFACCEMGGGMQVWYQYRFTVPAVSVEAMALHKIAGGCNFVGYYMYHGGSNPIGQHGYLNEHVTPRISYDFQAPLGEFGQVRDSYRALRLLHEFATEFASLLCPMATVLPASNLAIAPTNTDALRFAARVQGRSGFLFLNNYQDHVEMRDHSDIQLALKLDDETITLPQRGGLTLKRDTCAILPFQIDLDGVRLIYATTQLVTRLTHADEQVMIFFAPEGMESSYCFARATVAAITVESGATEEQDGRIYVSVAAGKGALIRLRTLADKSLTICTLTRQEALQLTKVELWGQERLILTGADLLVHDHLLELVSAGCPEFSFSLFPAPDGEIHGPDGLLTGIPDSLFTTYRIDLPTQEIRLDVRRVSDAKAVVRVPQDALTGVAELMLTIDYRGDVGNATIRGQLINDNFANGAPWEIGLHRFAQRMGEQAIDLYVTPLAEGAVVTSDSAMAAQRTIVGEQVAVIKSIEAIPHYIARIGHRLAARLQK